MKFARIIDLPNDEQVLVTRGWDENEGYIVELQTHIDGMSVVTTLTFNEESDRDNAFENWDNAPEFYDEMRKLLTEDEV